MRHLWLGAALLMCACQGAMVNEPFDPNQPESLIGEWSGRMIFMDDPSGNAKIFLRIRRVDASHVFGDMEVYGHLGPTITRRFRGTLNGNELWIGRWKLTVFRGRMTGYNYGSTLVRHGGAEIDLMKH